MSDSVPSRPKILVVDDNPANLLAMRRLLAKVDAELVEAASGAAALSACLDQQFAVILLDVQMPDIDGFEVAALLQEEISTRQTPIIFVTAAYADDLNRLKGYRVGAVDYIAKPINDQILLSKVTIFLELHRSRLALESALEQLYDRNRQLQDVRDEMRHLAYHDALTGLANRVLSMERMEGAVQRAERQRSVMAVLYIDIDGFKPVNDCYGHAAGDELLRQIAARLTLMSRKTDIVARLGGDEFAMILEGQADEATAMLVGAKVCRELAQPFELGSAPGTSINIGASVGIALYPTHGQTCDALVRAADEAMYGIKHSGKRRHALAAPAAPGASDP